MPEIQRIAAAPERTMTSTYDWLCESQGALSWIHGYYNKKAGTLSRVKSAASNAAGTAFLRSDIDDDVFMEEPPDLVPLGDVDQGVCHTCQICMLQVDEEEQGLLQQELDEETKLNQEVAQTLEAYHDAQAAVDEEETKEARQRRREANEEFVMSRSGAGLDLLFMQPGDISRTSRRRECRGRRQARGGRSDRGRARS